MKKYLLFFIVVIALTSCQNEIEFNTPAFQGLRDNTTTLWRADSFGAIINMDGSIIISGSNSSGTINLKLPFVEQNPNYVFIPGDVNSIEAEFITPDGVEFSTNNRPDDQVSIYPELGAIYINELDVVNNTVSGTFRFIAFNASGLNTVSFTGTTGNTDQSGNPIYGGFFYRIPIVSGTIPTDPFTCGDAVDAVITARNNYLSTFDGSQQYIDSNAFNTACVAYRQALELQMSLCGDVNGTIQTTIDNLGDCMITCAQATANRDEAETQYNNATVGNFIQNCNDFIFYLNEQITFCGDDTGAIQMTIDGLNCVDTDGDGVVDVLEDINADNDFNNDDTDNDLNADYIDDDDDDDLVLTANELMFDADGNPADTDGDGTPDYLDTDDDGDGVLTANEDVDADGDPTNDDTDGDGIPNYLDNDDDGDSVLSVFEVPLGDTDGDGTPNYLDVDDDGDSVFTIFESPDPDGDGNPIDALNTDGDLFSNYLDTDDDNDGLLTIAENPDPNGDGNPDDAQNSDADSIPDYLDAI